MLIIEINSTDNKFHHFQSQSHRKECWLDGHIEVPKELESKVYESGGYCELIIKNDILIDVILHPEWKPDETPESEPKPSDIDDFANAILEGVNEV